MKCVLLMGTVASLGLLTAAADQDSLGLGLRAPDSRPSGYTGAGPSLLAPGESNWPSLLAPGKPNGTPSPTTPGNPRPYDYPCIRPGQEGLGSFPLELVSVDPSTPVCAAHHEPS